jgi:hypothetical protein
MVLCSFCENITIDGIAVDYSPSLQRWEEPPGYNHAPDYPALLESAKTCELCRLIRDCGQDEGIIPEFDPKFDMVPDQITRRNASQRLKLRAFRQGGPRSSSKGLELGALHISNAQGLSIYLEMVADEGQSDEPQSILS